MCNLLTDRLPRSVTVGGTEHDVRWQYQYMVKVDMALRDAELGARERMLCAVRLFYLNGVPEDLGGAVRAMMGFYLGHGEMDGEGGGAAVYCFERDHEYIFAAFLQRYGVNLARAVDLHWYEFRAMLRGLDDCPFARIMGWRALDLTRIEDNGERQRMGEIKRRWALPVSGGERRAREEIEQILMGDGDLAGYEERRRRDG